jgi:hypothetical protein
MKGKNMEKQETVVAYPEIALAVRRDVQTYEPIAGWKVSDGEGSTNFANRTVSTPANGETARVLRGREMVRANISPLSSEAITAVADKRGVGEKTLMAVEQYRLNRVSSGRGFDTTEIVTGYEKQAGEDLAERGTRKAHDEAILTGASLAGTKAFAKFASGLKAGGQPEWATEVRAIQAKMKKSWKWHDADTLANGEIYELSDDGIEAPYGFVAHTGALAKEVEKHLLGEAQMPVGEFYGKGGVRYEVGSGADVFAPLIWKTDLPLSIRSKGNIHAKKRAINSGGAVRYPSRLITDSERRIFAIKRKAKGGIVVIDISGSMSLDSDDLDRILDHAPNATVFAYSHLPHDKTNKPNAFMLVRDGKRVAPEALANLSNVGNGVDAPALDFAISIKKGNEPIVWVCDGQVTGSTDRGSDDLTEIVAKMLWRNGIIQVPDTERAIEALKQPAKASVNKRYYGRVGREVEAIRKRGRR